MKMALNFNTKPQNEIFITSLFDVNKKCKIPQEKPPHPAQDASHTPPAEMKYTWGAAALVQDFTTRWRAREKHLSN
jgi:hypothetical protein